MRKRLDALRREEGFTLVELLVGSAMGVLVMGVVASLVIATMRTQPRISGEAQNVRTARWVLDRMTHEIRNGVAVKSASATEVSFEGYVRHSTCGGTTMLASTAPAILCQIKYACTTTSCSRTESPPGQSTGTAIRIFSGINSSQVFTYECPGESGGCATPAEATYLKATLRLPNPSGGGSATVSDGASLRGATLDN